MRFCWGSKPVGDYSSNPGEGNPKGRGRSPTPLCRFKGVRGEIEIPPGFSFGGVGRFLFSKEKALHNSHAPESRCNHLIFNSFAMSLRLIVRILETPCSCMVTP